MSGNGTNSVRAAIVGAGNCASSLVQGVEFYRRPRTEQRSGATTSEPPRRATRNGAHHSALHGDEVRSGPDETEDPDREKFIPGLMHANLGGYEVSDIRFVAAFDVSARKVGLDLSEAIHAEPNNTCRFAEVPPLNTEVQRGPTLDGLGRYLRDIVEESTVEPVDVASVLRRRRVDVLVSFLPVGSEQATNWYAEQALAAGCGFINCVPVFIASRRRWRDRFRERGLPLVGDDVKSQLGATITHRMLAQLFRDRGVRLERTYQLNFGGNTDFLNMLERERLESKKVSKTQAVNSQLAHPLRDGDIHIGPSDYVPWLGDRKSCYIRMEGTAFGNVPISCELKLEVWDSPNSAGVVIDAIRCAKLALDRSVGGPLIGPSSYFMKSPPRQFSDHEARRRTEAFIRKHRRPPSRPRMVAELPSPSPLPFNAARP